MDHKMRRLMYAAAGGVLAVASSAFAQEGGEAAAAAAPTFDTGDTAWMLTSTALVLMMTIPGLFLFYGGLVRSKNVLSTVMHSFFCAALISVTWVLYGYSLAFGPDVGGLIGGLDNVGMNNVLGTAQALAPTIPHILFVVYQATFAIITPALISGTFAERISFPAFALYAALVDLHLLPARALGMGRRLDRGAGRRARLRGRHRRPHLERHLRARDRHLPREAHGVSAAAHAAAQPRVLGDRRLAPLGRLVRLQRRQRGLVG